MKTPSLKSWSLRLITLAVWLLAVLCAAYWVLKFVTVKPANNVFAAAAPAITIDSDAVAKFLGAPVLGANQPIITPASSNYALFGIVRAVAGAGVALIATDGKPAKPYRVGSMVGDDLVLKSISRSDAILASSMSAPDGMKLELPIRAPAAVGAPMAPTANLAPSGRGAAPFQFPAPVAAAPNLAPQTGGLGAAMANAANPAGSNSFIPVQPDASAQRPVSRYAPIPQSEQSTSGRVPMSPPANASSATISPGVKSPVPSSSGQ